MALRDVPLPENLPADLTQLPGDDYRYAERFPDRAVVVLGINNADGEGLLVANTAGAYDPSVDRIGSLLPIDRRRHRHRAGTSVDDRGPSPRGAEVASRR